jgi:hypothetical protein
MSNTPPRLSSTNTVVTKSAVPGVALTFAFVSIVLVFENPKEWGLWFGTAICSVFFAGMLLRARHLYSVSVDNDCFLISGSRCTCRVPIKNLVSIERRFANPPTIIMHFSPPTPLGAKIRIEPPHDFLRMTQFNEVVAFLTGIIDSNKNTRD